MGKNIIIPHFENELVIQSKIFGVINPEQKYLIPGKGIGNERGNFGNLYLKFNIEYTGKMLTDNQIESLKNIL